MSRSYRSINIFVSHPFVPNNPAFDLEKFRTNIKLLVSTAENLVRKDFNDFDIETTFEFNDLYDGLPQQIESKIRGSHLGIVDISENKPNIFFEYGLLRGLSTPVLLIKANSTMDDFGIPADLKDKLVRTYDTFEGLINSAVDQIAYEFKRIIHSDSIYNVHLNKIWFPEDVQTVHVITSTESEKREQFASAEADNYMLLESLGDKDSLLFINGFLNRTYPGMDIKMHAADEFKGSLEDNLVIVGGPGDEDGDANPICKIMMEKMKTQVSYSEDCEKLLYKGQEYTAEKKGKKTSVDYGYFARFPNPFNPKTSVVLVNGIHTFGVLGAAQAFSDHAGAQGNIKAMLQKLEPDDIKKASFECFFQVEVYHHNVVCPKVDADAILPLG